jgi:hypothetical protein
VYFHRLLPRIVCSSQPGFFSRPPQPGAFSLALERLHRPNVAKVALRELETDPSNALQIALVHAQHRNSDRAFKWLSEAVSNLDSHILDIKWYPALEPIRRDPRFVQLMEKLGVQP